MVSATMGAWALLILAVVWSVAAIGWYLLARTWRQELFVPGAVFSTVGAGVVTLFWAVLLSCSALLWANYRYQRYQRHFYEVWFMPQAVAFIQCPSTFREYWKQRKRWAQGGWHLLRTHKDIFKDFRYRYLYPAYLETVLSFFWSFVFVFGTS